MPKFTDFSGIEVPQDLQVLKGKKGDKYIISLITPDKLTWELHTHFLEGYGSIECFNGQCCLDNSKVNTNYVFPTLKYTNNGAKITNYGSPVSFHVWKIGTKIMKKLKSLGETGVDINNVDLLIECVEEGFQQWEVTPINKPEATWKTLNIQEDIEEFKASYVKNVEKTLKIKPMTAEKYSGLFTDPEYLDSVQKWEQRKLLSSNGQNQPVNNGYVNNLPNAMTPKALPSPTQSISQDEFESLIS